MLLTAAHIDDN